MRVVLIFLLLLFVCAPRAYGQEVAHISSISLEEPETFDPNTIVVYGQRPYPLPLAYERIVASEVSEPPVRYTQEQTLARNQELSLSFLRMNLGGNWSVEANQTRVRPLTGMYPRPRTVLGTGIVFRRKF